MRVFDFDNTIYNGESVVDFYFFSVKYNPKVLKYLFILLYNTAKYKLGKTTMESLENVIAKHAEGYLRALPNIEGIVSAFWDKNMAKIKPWYKSQKDDVIFTASFNIIMDELFRRIGTTNSVCSVYSMDSMKAEYINFSHNKLKKFREKFGNDAVADEFYTDSAFDSPMMQAAKKAFIVKKNKITRIK